LPRGLGPNKGNENWKNESEKRQKVNNYSEKLREMNKKYGLMSVGSKSKLIGAKKVVEPTPLKSEPISYNY
jgi:16S rRNA G527 N7-methylase RsmG